MYWQNRIGGQSWLDYTDGQIAELEGAFSEQGVPVFLGETTSRYPYENFANDAQYTESSQCLEVILDKLTEHGFVPVLWDVTDNFYSRDTCEIKDGADAEVIKKISEKLKK